jgi:type III secretory pathway component EscV
MAYAFMSGMFFNKFPIETFMVVSSLLLINSLNLETSRRLKNNYSESESSNEETDEETDEETEEETDEESDEETGGKTEEEADEETEKNNDESTAEETNEKNDKGIDEPREDINNNKKSIEDTLRKNEDRTQAASVIQACIRSTVVRKELEDNKKENLDKMETPEKIELQKTIGEFKQTVSDEKERIQTQLLSSSWSSLDEISSVSGLPPFNSSNETPTSTVSPSSTSNEVTVPLNGDGTSVSTLSVEISNIGYSSLTSSPTCTSQRKIVPSVTVSPSCGIVTI